MKQLIYCSIILICGISAFGQNKEADTYRKASEEIRKQVWGWDKPQFKVREVPAKYASASKIIIAHHTELTADSKSKLAFYGLGFGLKKELTLSEIVREAVKVNDKTAVSEYSELSFTQFAKSSGFLTTNRTTSYIGIRVIKPNGSIKEINADDIVLTTDASNEKKAKVAIPDLQPGDILDYFLATEQTLTNDISNKPYHLLLFDDAPIMSLSFHAQLGKRYAIEYRSYNGAPDLEVSKDDDKDIIADVVKTDIPPFETSLWVAPGLQLPFIRMNISLGHRGSGSVMKPGVVSKNSESDEFLQEKASSLSASYYSGYWMKAGKLEYDQLEGETRKKLKQSGISFKDLSDGDKAAQLYYTLRYTKMLNFNIDDMAKKINIGNLIYDGLAFPLFATFKAAGLDPAIMVSTTRTGYRLSEIMDRDDLSTTAYLPTTNQFFSIESVYDIPFAIPDEVEGLTQTKSFTFDHPAMIMTPKKMMGLTNIAEGPKVPLSTSDKNAHIESLKLSFTADKNNLSVNRKTTLSGFYKIDAQRQMILYEDYYEQERKAFNDDKSLIDQLEDNKKGRKYVDEVKNAFAVARKNQKDEFVKEAKDWFDQEVTDLKDYKTDNLGVRHTAPDFIYSSSFYLGGLVKKAGNNIIVEIGKIQGQPFVVKPEQRKRDIDIYMPFARSVEYNIELEIPAGYSAEGIAALNKKVENETGYFSVEASASDKLVKIKLKKHYLHNYEPLKNWDKVTVFMDAANDWTSAKILFKKK